MRKCVPVKTLPGACRRGDVAGVFAIDGRFIESPEWYAFTGGLATSPGCIGSMPYYDRDRALTRGENR